MNQDKVSNKITKFNLEWNTIFENYFEKTKEMVDEILRLTLEPLNLSVEDFKKLTQKEFLKLAKGKLKIDFVLEEISGERDKEFIIINDIIKVDYYNKRGFHEVTIKSLLDLRNYDGRFSDIEGFVSWFKPLKG